MRKFKKIIAILSLVSLILSTGIILVPAETISEEEPIWWDAVITEEDLAQWETVDGIYNDISSYATGLITSKSLHLAKTTDGMLAVSGVVECVTDVDKCGFTYVKIQRKIGSNWIDYLGWTDLLDNAAQYAFGKYIQATSGYSYRAICNHYALKERWLFPDEEQNIYNETTSLYY